MKIVNFINNYAENIAINTYIRNSYGLARSILATGTFLTLLFNDTHILFIRGEGVVLQRFSFLANISLFALLDDSLEIAKYLSLAILLVVIIGWKPRLTGFLHWYVAHSFFTHCTIIDGGDHIASILSFLLIPMCLLDGRKWHWDRYPTSKNSNSPQSHNLIAWGSILLIRMQVCIIYFQAGIGKINVDEWRNGTAFFYWGLHPFHGMPDYIKPLLQHIINFPFTIVVITWGTIIFELVLASALVMKKDDLRRKILLVMGLIFHFFIILVHGLVSFFFSISAALILYLYPLNTDITFDYFKKWYLYLKYKQIFSHGKS